jgi:hypothetical protein
MRPSNSIKSAAENPIIARPTSDRTGVKLTQSISTLAIL